MFESIIWCPSWFYFELLSGFRKLCWWHHSLYLWTGLYSIIKVIEPNVNKLFNWFRQNGLLSNSGNSYFLTSPCEKRSLKIYDWLITSGSSKELLRVLIETELTFHYHITRICSKANQKLSALARFSKYITLQKKTPAYELLQQLSV